MTVESWSGSTGEIPFELGPEAKERVWCIEVVEKGICPKKQHLSYKQGFWGYCKIRVLFPEQGNCALQKVSMALPSQRTDSVNESFYSPFHLETALCQCQTHGSHSNKSKEGLCLFHFLHPPSAWPEHLAHADFSST